MKEYVRDGRKSKLPGQVEERLDGATITEGLIPSPL